MVAVALTWLVEANASRNSLIGERCPFGDEQVEIHLRRFDFDRDDRFGRPIL